MNTIQTVMIVVLIAALWSSYKSEQKILNFMDKKCGIACCTTAKQNETMYDCSICCDTFKKARCIRYTNDYADCFCEEPLIVQREIKEGFVTGKN